MISTVQTNNKESHPTTIENNSNTFSLFSSTNDHYLRKTKNSHKRRQGNVSEGLTTYKYSTKPNKRKKKEKESKIGNSAFSPFSRAISKIRQLSTKLVLSRVYASLPLPLIHKISSSRAL